MTTEDAKLPALIDRACNRLEAARTSAEVLEAKAIAEAALHYSRVTQAANETQAYCLRMIVRAEIRMANEIDRGQSSGEIAKAGRPSSNSPNFGQLGVDSRRVAEWRDTRDAGEQVIEAAISSALSEGRAPTKADVRRAVAAPIHQKPGAPSNGLQFARIAIMKLEEIRENDTQRQQAFDLVRRWLDARET